MTHRTDRSAHIDLDVIAQNVATIVATVSPAAVMVVAKADGYGHGASHIARAALAGGAAMIGVADVEEALELRRAKISEPILAWLHGPSVDFELAVYEGIDLGISSVRQLDAIAEVGGAARIHLKLDTGLSRNGIATEDADEFFQRAARLQRQGRIDLVGLFTHLSNTSIDENRKQIRRFDALSRAAAVHGLRPRLRHIGGSFAAFTEPPSSATMFRVGIAVYGYSPDSRWTASELGLRPALTLTSEVAAVRRVPSGTGVSYDYSFRTERPARLALVPLGYADGLPRAASNSADVSIRGRRYPVVGRIAMDQLVISVGDDEIAVGDPVVLWGDAARGEPTLEEWAAAAGTISYELLTHLGRRVIRTYPSTHFVPLT